VSEQEQEPKHYSVSFSNFKTTLNTHGNGWWSREERKITHSKAVISYYGDDSDLSKIKYAELKVFFPKKDWDVEKHGLIYTDKAWLRELRAYLKGVGFSNKAVNDVDYSEQGMQGDNYVSLDIGKSFLKEAALRINK